MKQYILLSFSLFVLLSCGNEPKPAKEAAVVKEEQPALPIREFIKKFKIIQTPFYYLGGYAGINYEKQLFELKKNSIDTLFHNVPNDAPVYGYAMLADTSKFYSLIFFHAADDLYPVLYTYSKSGQLLSEESLIVRGCGSDCGLKYCSNSARIDKNFSIYLADTVYYEGTCDSAGNYTTGDSTFIYSKTGSIDKSGKIKMSEELEQRTGGKK
jgi:hypothetical protein